MRKSVLKYFVPQSDITAFELAMILTRINAPAYYARPVHFTEEQFEALDPGMKRHFADEKPSL